MASALCNVYFVQYTHLGKPLMLVCDTCVITRDITLLLIITYVIMILKVLLGYA